MRMDKFTLKAQEAVEQAVQIAEKFKHQQVDCEHLLYSLLKQTDTIVPEILEKVSFSIYPLIKKIEEILQAKPKQYGQEIKAYLSNRLN
ncbi:MAG: type VI secretion system ATPase TssH, partial [Candidatus Omnitrophica bacterium]|nr:type VI secretion system ATPase TssH [Candidatus Omnitrophota bacterium]